MRKHTAYSGKRWENDRRMCMRKKSDAFSILIYLAILIVGALIYGLVKDIGVKPPAITEDDVTTVSMYFDGP